MSDYILNSLNDKQKEAVITTEGPVLVVAGAGSGKTKALTHRIAYLIEEKKIAPWNILAVTFTNKAATEMKERVLKLLNKDKNDKNIPTIGTFHSICVKILRKHIHLLSYDSTFNIYDTTDQEILIKHVMKDLYIDTEDIKPRALMTYISTAKNDLLTPEKYSNMVHNYFTEQVAKVYKEYQKRLKQNNAVDFDDIIMLTVKLFVDYPEILNQYQEKFRYIMVDEYQDTNMAQYKLISLLALKYKNLCVIGDSDQSIYSFRGADISNILNFEKDYKNAKVIMLEQNYRSTKPILDAAHFVISKNKQRKDKRLWTEKEEGELISFRELNDEREEAIFVINQIKARLEQYEYPKYNDFVVLYRTNAQSRVLEEAFLRHGIPYKIIGGIKFYSRKEIKDIIAYLKLIQNPSDSVSLFRIINTPARKIGTKTLEEVQKYASINNITIFTALEESNKIEQIPKSKQEMLQNFAKMIREFQSINHKHTASSVIKYVIDKSGYKTFINDGTKEGESRLENIYELISVANKYSELEPGISLKIFLEEISLISDVDTLDDEDNAVTLMTIHSAKGLEFDTVFLVGLEEGVLPHSRSLLEPQELEEERRLMYVAITRAKNKLYLLRAKNRTLYGQSKSNAISQFIKDIDDSLFDIPREERTPQSLNKYNIEYNPIPYENQYEETYTEEVGEATMLYVGDRIMHKTFGEGTVISIMGGVAEVKFDSVKYGTRKLAISIAPITKLD